VNQNRRRWPLCWFCKEFHRRKRESNPAHAGKHLWTDKTGRTRLAYACDECHEQIQTQAAQEDQDE
jgi:hypothetical protein